MEHKLATATSPGGAKVTPTPSLEWSLALARSLAADDAATFVREAAAVTAVTAVTAETAAEMAEMAAAEVTSEAEQEQLAADDAATREAAAVTAETAVTAMTAAEIAKMSAAEVTSEAEQGQLAADDAATFAREAAAVTADEMAAAEVTSEAEQEQFAPLEGVDCTLSACSGLRTLTICRMTLHRLSFAF